MRFTGRVFEVGTYWAIEVPLLGVTTQGHTKEDAYAMIQDAIETLVFKKDFHIAIHPGKAEYFEISSNDPATLVAFMLRRLRQKHGLTLSEVSKRMGAKSHNAYARYEKGRSVPSIQKLEQLIAAVAPEHDFILDVSQVS